MRHPRLPSVTVVLSGTVGVGEAVGVGAGAVTVTVTVGTGFGALPLQAVRPNSANRHAKASTKILRIIFEPFRANCQHPFGRL